MNHYRMRRLSPNGADTTSGFKNSPCFLLVLLFWSLHHVHQLQNCATAVVARQFETTKFDLSHDFDPTETSLGYIDIELRGF
eukprot:m.1646585 g.1646585  ORF g.1646585 m.1646585 type:complete len:82 (-) comp71647_c0_seq1:19-264(-)